MNKQELRYIYLSKRKKLSKEECREKSLLIANTFFNSIDIRTFSVVHLFLPIANHNEPDTFLLIDAIRQRSPETKILIPVTEPGTKLLKNVLLTKETILKVNKWGIPEPEHPEYTSLQPDLVVLPLLAFDKRGYRIGYGKGFYDRYLASLKVNPYKAGISFFQPVEIIEGIDPYDIPMDICFCPKEVYRFDNKRSDDVMVY
ncbi:5-formyltetrahydrofolate cyclo-ligase [Cytophagaceae bacterium ABcell3]|nr:5-formyltetrahydrofolate cyclo-ligase [Cytophagaceae bacterium ABcell3]